DLRRADPGGLDRAVAGGPAAAYPARPVRRTRHPHPCPCLPPGAGVLPRADRLLRRGGLRAVGPRGLVGGAVGLHPRRRRADRRRRPAARLERQAAGRGLARGLTCGAAALARACRAEALGEWRPAFALRASAWQPYRSLVKNWRTRALKPTSSNARTRTL